MRKFWKFFVATSLVAFSFTLAFAQPESVRIEIGTNPGVGNYLTDGSGRALYVFEEELDGGVACVDECTIHWPPFLSEERPLTAPGLIPGFVGVTERPDGTSQVTFRGRPLYYFVDDIGAGDINGQAQDGQWYVLSTTGDLITALPAAAEPESDTPGGATELVNPAVMAVGQELYMQICVACHAADGQGGQGGPSLVDREVMADTRRMVDQIVFGGGDMPSFGHMYDDEQIAAIATYTRNTWGNSYGPVSPEDVNR